MDEKIQKIAGKKSMIGLVVSDKMDKTVVVLVTSKKKHPIYGKYITFTKKYKAHDENGVAGVGDTVKIMETRPLSATKHFRLVEVIKKASIA